MSAPRVPWWAEGWKPSDDPNARPVLVACLSSRPGGHGLAPVVRLELAPGWRTGPEELRSVAYGPLEGWTWSAEYRPPWGRHLEDDASARPWTWTLDHAAGSYRDRYSVCHSQAQSMAKALGRIAGALRRKEDKEGPADRPALWLPRLAQALGVRAVILERCGGPDPDRRPWCGMGPDTMRRPPAQAGSHLESLAEEVRKLRLPETLPEEVPSDA